MSDPLNDALARISAAKTYRRPGSQQIAAVSVMRPLCIHRGPTKRIEKTTKCCGDVEIFDCANLGHEVWATKCRPCAKYEAVLSPGARAEEQRRGASLSIAVVMASRNEGRNLTATVASVKLNCPQAEIIVGDDASDKPEPIATFRNPQNIGSPMTRRKACDMTKADVAVILDPHEAFDSETARYINALHGKPPISSTLAASLDCQGDAILRLALTAHDCGGIAYPVCMSDSCRFFGACLVQERGVYGLVWGGKRGDKPMAHSAPLSGCYAVSRKALDALGGWPALPGFLGAEELAVSLMSCGLQIPIMLVPDVFVWHLFRGKQSNVPVPFSVPGDRSNDLNIAASYRVAFDDAYWAAWRGKLSTAEGKRGPIDPRAIEYVEGKDFMAYAASVRERFTRTSAEIVAEVDRMIGEGM